MSFSGYGRTTARRSPLDEPIYAQPPVELHLGTLFEAVTDAFGDDAALIHGAGPEAERWTWSEYDQVASRFAGFLAATGAKASAAVGLYLYNGPPYLIAQAKSAASFPMIGGRRYVVAGDWATVEADGRIALAHLRSALAGYKLPRRITFVERVERAPNGKADYAWAKRIASRLTPEE